MLGAQLFASFRDAETFPVWDTVGRDAFQAARRFNLPPARHPDTFRADRGLRMRRVARGEFDRRHPELLSNDPNAAASLAADPVISPAQRDLVYRELGVVASPGASQTEPGYERYNMMKSISTPDMHMRDVYRLREKECRTCFQPNAEPATISLPPVASASPPPLLPILSSAASAASLRSLRAEAHAREAATVVRPACEQAVKDAFWRPKPGRYGIRCSEPTQFANNFIATKMVNSVRNTGRR